MRLQAAGLAAVLTSTVASAAAWFQPTPAEWATWPEYCRARYVLTYDGKQSPYAAIYPAAGAQRWKTLLGEQAFTALHHYCAGIVWLQRSSVASSQQQRTHALRIAVSECRFTFERIPRTTPIYREVAMNLQLAQSMLETALTTAPR
jgi:hypothetical protein